VSIAPVFGALAAVVNNDFLRLGLLNAVAVEADAQVLAGQNQNIVGAIVLATAGVGTGTVTYTLRVNGVDTEIAIPLLATGTTAEYFVLTADIMVIPQSLLSVRATFSGTVTTGHSNVRLSLCT
jgi:hypothetical protein